MLALQGLDLECPKAKKSGDAPIEARQDSRNNSHLIHQCGRESTCSNKRKPGNF
jgi:hypothetical protein